MPSPFDDAAFDGTTSPHAGIVARPKWAFLAFVLLVVAFAVALTQKVDPLPGRLGAPSWLEWLRYPIETHAMRRLPGAPATMLDVRMLSTGTRAKDQKVWAVGRGGTIMFSQDGGESWLAQERVTDGDLFDLDIDEKGQVGWAVGPGGTIVRTKDGQTWERVPVARLVEAALPDAMGNSASVEGLGVLMSVQVLPPDGRTVFISSQRGRLFKSVDGGGSWRELPGSPVRDDLTGLRMHRSGLFGWLGGPGAIGFTEDGGTTWQAARIQSDDLGASPVEPPVFLEDRLKGWAVARNGVVLHSEDGGRSWRQIARVARDEPVAAGGDPGAPPARRPVGLRGLHVHAKGSMLWTSAADGSIWRSTDGGHHWDPSAAGTRTLLRRIVMDDDGVRGWAVGSDGVILSTEDQGRSWAQRTQGAVGVMLASHASDDGLHLWVAGHEGQLLASTDGGKSWTLQDTGVGLDSLHGLTFLSDDKTGWAVTSRGAVIATRDGGRHWDAPKTVAQRRLRSIHASPDGRKLWVAGEEEELWHSDDGGERWRQQEIQRPPKAAPDDAEKDKAGAKDKPRARLTLNRVRFQPDGRIGWVVGNSGLLARTEDGGKTWKAAPLKPDGGEPLTRPLRDITLAEDGLRAWIVGDSGVIVATADGGQKWVRRDSGTRASLLALDFSRDGKIGWAAGEGGAIVFTKDGGERWAPAATVGSARTSVAMDPTGRTGWAFGYPPSLLSTDDYGGHWTRVDWPFSPERYPAPWFWIALVLAGAALWNAFRPLASANTQGVEAMGTTDAPTEDFARDRLEFTPLARGISRFLRNSRTEPPLTIAVSGDWGSGKSSLMALVCADLRRYGSRPVWFNAWHHQSEEQMLAALLTGIRDQGLPPLRSPEGWVFRLRLLWLRSHKHFIYALLVLLALATLVGYFAKARGNPAEWSRLAATLAELGPKLESMAKGQPAPGGGLKSGDLGLLGGQLAALLAGATAIWRALKAFGADPAVLAAKAAVNMKMKDASAQTGFRARYAEQFDEVTQALPYRLVIVIDDLDRCKPEAVLSVMEAVNFLVSSGRCFVIFGLSTARVEAALALAFEKIAKELVELDVSLPPNATAEQKERAERDRRRAYVRDYLEKLINLEITVPQRADLVAEKLLRQEARDDTRTLLRQALVFWPLLLGAAVVLAGLTLGGRDFGSGLRATYGNPQATLAAAAGSEGEGDAGAGAAIEPTRSASAAAPVSRPNSAPVVTKRSADQDSMNSKAADLSMWPLAAAFTALALAAAGLLVYRLRSAHRHVDDTPAFTNALQVWLPVVAQRRPTPRVVKRFGNRLRYLAMLQQAELPDLPLREEIELRLRRWTGIGWQAFVKARREKRAAHPQLAEHRLVLLGALHQIYGSGWLARAQAGGEPPPGDEDLHKAVAAAIDAYKEATNGTAWPPTEDELKMFERALRGIRLSARLDAAAAPAPAAPA